MARQRARSCRLSASKGIELRLPKSFDGYAPIKELSSKTIHRKSEICDTATNLGREDPPQRFLLHSMTQPNCNLANKVVYNFYNCLMS